MDPNGHIYELSDEDQRALAGDFTGCEDDEAREQIAALREDVARLDGYLRARAESDAPKRGKGANKDLAG